MIDALDLDDHGRLMDTRCIVPTLRLDCRCFHGYMREVPYGCIDQGLLSVMYFLPGQAMAPHRHLDSDEYFTAVQGDATMVVNGERVMLPEGSTFLRHRGVLHAIRNDGPVLLVVQSFQTPLPADEATVWERIGWWQSSGNGCPRCWCGQTAGGCCLNCGADWPVSGLG